MPRIDEGPLGRSFEHRLRVALDRVEPRFGAPRYLGKSGRVRSWRVAPVALAVGLAGVLVLSVSTATGSVNPRAWTNRIVTVIEPSPVLDSSPTPAPPPSQAPSKAVAAPVRPSQQAGGHPSPAAGEHDRPEPSDTPGAGTRPSPRPSPWPTPWPSPWPTDDPVWHPSPSPNPTDH